MYKKQKLKNYDFCFKRWSRKSYAAFNSMHSVVKMGVMKVGVSIVMLTTQNVFAQDTLTPARTATLDEIVVTGQRESALPNVVRTMAVITRAEVEPAPLPSLNNLLRSLPSLDLRQRGPLGTQADLSIRGGTFDQTQILINGINFSDPQTGHYSLDLPVELAGVLRVEVLQGLNAPGAIGGAVNIMTGGRDFNTVNLTLSGGRWGYFNLSGNATVGDERLSAYISASHQQSDGYITNTDFQTGNIFTHVSYAAPAGRFEAQLGYQDKAYGSNGFYSFSYPNQFEQVRTLLGSLRWQKDIGVFNFSAAAYYRGHADRFELFRNDFPDWYTGHNYHQTTTVGGKALVSAHSVLGETNFSVEIRNEHIYSNVLGEPMPASKPVPFEGDAVFTKEAGRLLLHAFLSQRYSWRKWTATAGLSYHHSNDFGNKFCGAADLRYNWDYHWASFIAINQSLRLPTFTDLFYTTATHQGNPHLLPEEALTGEIGTAFAQPAWRSSLSLFYRKGKNLIDWVYTEGGARSQSRNYSGVDAVGTEFQLQWNNRETHPRSFFRRAGLAYSFTYVDKAPGELETSYVLDYLRHKLTLTAEHELFSPKLKAAWALAFQDRAGTYADYHSGEVRPFDAFALLDLRLNWEEKHAVFFVEINNIFDTTYFDYAGLPQPGLWWLTGVKMKL